MKISTKGRYALRLMLDLAVNYENKPITIKDIASRQQISDKYLEQIIAILNKAGFVKSVRGASGGYSLKREPEEYTVGMILRQTEGDLAPVSCVGAEREKCPNEEICTTIEIWQRLDKAINDVVDNITLADLVKWHNEKTTADIK